MLLQRLFCLFAPAVPNRQVVPLEKENDHELLSSTRLMIRSFKKKFNSDTAGSNVINSERDCVALSETIQIDEYSTVFHLFADPTKIIIISFGPGDKSLASLRRGKNPLVLSQLRMLVGKTITRDSCRESTSSDLRVLVDVVSGFVDMLQRLQRRLHRRQETNLKSQPTSNHPNSLTHEGSVVLTNLFLSAIYDYINTPKSNSTTPMCPGFYSCFERLCLSLKTLCVGAPPNCSRKVKLLFCQCISTASKIIPSLGFYYAGNVIAMPTDNQIRHLASALQIMAFSLMSVRQLIGEESYGATMLYWSACDAVPCIIDMAATSFKVQANESAQSKFSASMIFQALAMTCPSPQELEDEIRRLQRPRPFGPSPETAAETPILLTARGDSSSQSCSTREIDTTPTPASTTSSFSSAFNPYRVQYLLEGLQRVLRAGILDIGNSGSVLRLREEWLTCFARILLFVLDQLPHPFAIVTSFPLSAKRSNNAINLIELAPVLAEMFLEISMSFDFSMTREFDWIYTDLTKRLVAFMDRLKQKKKLSHKQVMRKRPSLPLKGSADMSATPSAASVLRDIQASYGKDQLTLPLWQIKPQSPTYMLEEAVDGHFKLGNGSQRWYPGRITGVNADGTYTLTYLDGDVHPNKDPSEIRQTKNWKLSSARSSSRSGMSSIEGGSSLRDSFVTVNSDAINQSIAISSSPFKAQAPSRKKSMNNTTPRLLGVVEHSESCTPPLGTTPQGSPPQGTPLNGSSSESADDDSIKVVVSGVPLSPCLPPIAEVSCATDELSRTNNFDDITVSSAFHDKPGGSEIDKDGDGSTSVKSNFSDISVQSADSNQSCQQTFAIPSVFDTPRQEMKIDALPKMQLSNLEFSSAASQCSGMSLSAFLCRDNLCESPGPDDYGGDNGEGDCEGDFEDDGLDSSKPPSPRNSNSDWLMLSPGTAQRQKQRATSFSKDASIPQTPYSTHSHSHLGPAPKPAPMGGPCEALLAASYEVYRSSGGSPNSDMQSSTNSNRIVRPQRKCSSFSVSGIADRVKDNGRLACLEDANYNTSLRAFSIVSALLIQHCIVGKGNFLDINSCSTSDPSAEGSGSLRVSAERHAPKEDPVRRLSCPNANLPPLGNEFVNWKQEKQINILFSVREFLEKISDTERRKAIPFLTEISNFSMGASMRVLKLVSPSMFNSCLPSHMGRAKKIGDGGFGSVFRVTCDASCSKCGSWDPCRGRTDSLEAHLSSRKGSIGETTVTDCLPQRATRHTETSFSSLARKDSGCSSSAARTTYAVKRIPRERSMHDSPLIYEVFNEITCLQMLSGNRGVCELIDFGVHGMEYWIVLEAGQMDLRAWRHSIISRERASILEFNTSAKTNDKDGFARTNSLIDLLEGENEGSPYDEAIRTVGSEKACPLTLTVHNLKMCLALYADALLIVQSVHAVHVLHFDIKCNNFILHSEPDLEVMLLAHSKGMPSGFLFLADFGESVPSLYSTGPSGETSEAGGEVSLIQRSVTGRGPSSLSRSRGTLPIQSPEMLSLTATGGARPSFAVPNTRKKIPRASGETSLHSSSESECSNENHPFAAPTKRQFPPPSAASDIWSLGCLLVELVSGDYLMKNRPWTDLYVSLCMSNFRSPSLGDFQRALAPVNLSPKHVSVLESVIRKCLMQNPSLRSPISEIYDDVMSLLDPDSSDSECSREQGATDPKKPTSASASTSGEDRQHEVESMTWNILNWNTSFTKLRPRSLDFRGGCGLTITLLSANERFSHDFDPLALPNTLARTEEEDATQHWSSSSGSRPHLFTSYPYIDMSVVSSHGSNSGDELKRRLDAVTQRIATCTLASCAKSLAMKSVTTSARTRGLLHIEISCCSIDRYHSGECKAFSKDNTGGIEQLVLPYNEREGCTGTMESRDRSCDSSVMKAIERLLQRAQAVLSEDTPPSVLITIAPTPSAHIGRDTDSCEEKEDSCAHISPRAKVPRSGKLEDVPRKSESSKSRCFLDAEHGENADEEPSEEDNPQCPLYHYSSVALTVASLIANNLTDHVRATHQHKLDCTGPLSHPSPNSPTRKTREKYTACSLPTYSVLQKGVRNHTKPWSLPLPVSQRVVAPWLRKSLHPELKIFLSRRLNLPITIVPTFKTGD